MNIGQEIVCIKSHPDGVVKEGEIFTLQGIMKCRCSCCEIVVNVGINHHEDFDFYDGCALCGTNHQLVKNDGIWWLDIRRFTPLDTLADISELTEILETTKPYDV